MLELAAEPGPGTGYGGAPGNAPPRGVGASALCGGRWAQVAVGLGARVPLGLGVLEHAFGSNEPSPAGERCLRNAGG